MLVIRRAPSRMWEHAKDRRKGGFMPIKGVHAMFYSSDAEGLRAFLRDRLGLAATDVGEGWLVFDVPEADMGVHPTDGEPPSGTADISFYCDDLDATVRELRENGVEPSSEVEDRGWGLVTTIPAPGGIELMLYEPRYSKG